METRSAASALPERRIRLAAGDLTVEVDPGAGGSLASFRLRDLALLRSGSRGPAGDIPAQSMACFPMVPFVNRLHRGRFGHAGRTIFLERNSPDAHPLHGQGWLSAWEARVLGDGLAQLSMTGRGKDWPWHYEATQRFELTAESLTITLGLHNLADEAFPFGLGLHPFFPRATEALLQAPCRRIWSRDEAGIPTEAGPIPAEFDFSEPRRVADATLDHCFDGWSGQAMMSWPAEDVSLVMETEGCSYLQIYSPAGEPYFCAEPMTARPDAFNARESDIAGLDVIEPGGRRQISLRLRVVLRGA
jgi:aldose 1-epimerase